MHLKKIELLNFKGIKKFESDFSGNVYFITGENELGKSTVLEAIVRMLTGNRENVLKNGEEKGSATIEVGDYTVEWKFTEKNPRGTMTIKSADGMKSENISMLQKVFGYQDFDAEEFSRWSETAEGRRKQVEVVKALLPEATQKRLLVIDSDTKLLYETRKDQNSTVKTYKTLEEKSEKELPNNPENYTEPVEVENLLETQKQETQLEERYNQAKAKKAEREKQIAEIPTRLKLASEKYEADKKEIAETLSEAEQTYKEAIAKAEKDWKAAKEKSETGNATALKDYETTTQTIEAEKTDFETKLKNANDFIDKYEKTNTGETVSEKLAKAKTHNENYEKVKAFEQAKANRIEAEKTVEKTQSKMDALAAEKEQLIKSAKLPIDGLNFTDDGLELKGVPFAPGKVSDSQIMEVATNLIIASNPNVKVFRIARGESLGATKLQALVKLAKEKGYQGFIENVVRNQNELRVEEYTEK